MRKVRKNSQSAIPCPHCGEITSRVIESRGRDISVWRLRLCLSCEDTFETLEQLTFRNALIVEAKRLEKEMLSVRDKAGSPEIAR